MSDRGLRDALEKLVRERSSHHGSDPGDFVIRPYEIAELLRAHPAEPVGVSDGLPRTGAELSALSIRTHQAKRAQCQDYGIGDHDCSEHVVGVSDEAVEAAARALYESPPDNMSRAGYERAERDVKDIYRSEARAALEAAQPLLGTRPQPTLDRDRLIEVIETTTKEHLWDKVPGSDEDAFEFEPVAPKVADAVLALVRPLPTREQIAHALSEQDGHGADWDSPSWRAGAEQHYGARADAVLALMGGTE